MGTVEIRTQAGACAGFVRFKVRAGEVVQRA
jgi:hypothetical protein